MCKSTPTRLQKISYSLLLAIRARKLAGKRHQPAQAVEAATLGAYRATGNRYDGVRAMHRACVAGQGSVA